MSSRTRRLLVTNDYGMHYALGLDTDIGDWTLRLWLTLIRLWTRGFRPNRLVTVCLGSGT